MIIDAAYLEKSGFEGFIPLSDLHSFKNKLPDDCGVYVVLRPSMSSPTFITSPAGRFKNLDPSYPKNVLIDKWVGSSIVYIGKAGPSASRTLRKRVGEFLRFGSGARVGHRGGRAVWQIADAWSCLMAWKTCSAPRDEERMLISIFERTHGKIPFANFNR